METFTLKLKSIISGKTRFVTIYTSLGEPVSIVARDEDQIQLDKVDASQEKFTPVQFLDLVASAAVQFPLNTTEFIQKTFAVNTISQQLALLNNSGLNLPEKLVEYYEELRVWFAVGLDLQVMDLFGGNGNFE